MIPKTKNGVPVIHEVVKMSSFLSSRFDAACECVRQTHFLRFAVLFSAARLKNDMQRERDVKLVHQETGFGVE